MKEMHVAAFNTQERDFVAKLIVERIAEPREGDDPELVQGCAEMFLRALPLGALEALRDA